jgi:signal transduction histidine kinase
MAREENGMIVIEVRDRGIGIPDAERHKIMQRFFRASNAKAITGTGLGLYAAQRLLAYHQGTLHLAPNDAGGTIATVRVPRSIVPEDREA